MPKPIPSIRTVFLDRDGVINGDSADYIRSVDQFHFIPGSLTALVHLHRAGCRVIVVTNQSGVGRGIIRPQDLTAIHRKMDGAVQAAGGRLADILACPHRPDEDCPCRKPRPGMVHSAVHRHQVDLRQAVLVGDSARDIACGQRAGCIETILVRTGNGRATEPTLAGTPAAPTHIAADLRAAVNWLADTGRIPAGKPHA